MGTLLLRLRAAAVKYIEFIFLARYPIWRDRAGAAHCTLYTDKLDHLPDIGQHGAHPFLTTPPRDHVRHAIHKSKTARSSWHDRSVVDHTQCRDGDAIEMAAHAVQIAGVGPTFVQLACNHSHHDPRWLATR